MATPQELRDPTNRGAARKTIAIISAALAIMFGYTAITVPMIMASGPAIFAVAFAALAFIAWPKHPGSRSEEWRSLSSQSGSPFETPVEQGDPQPGGIRPGPDTGHRPESTPTP